MSKEDTATAADVRAPDRFNNYVLRTVEMLARERAAQGYDLHSYFTQDLSYGRGSGRIKANHPPLTMCVAAVTEVMIFANTAALGATAPRTRSHASASGRSCPLRSSAPATS